MPSSGRSGEPPAFVEDWRGGDGAVTVTLASPEVHSVARSAVVVGDLQLGITLGYPFAAELVPRAAALAAQARERGDLVVFVRTWFRVNGADVSPHNAGAQAIFGMGDTFHEGSAGVELDPGLGCRPGDVVVTKRRASGFAGTDLDMVLRASGVDTLVVAGVATSAMVAATVYDAADRDFRVRVAADVCADPVDAVHRFLIDTLFPARGFEIVTAG
jgi:nicotinamidase-related amidase